MMTSREEEELQQRMEKKGAYLANYKGQMASDLVEESPSDVLTRYEAVKLGKRLPNVRDVYRTELVFNLARRRVLPQAVAELRELADWMEEWGATENPFIA